MKFIKLYLSDDRGATAIEYGLIAALVAVALIVGATKLGTSITDIFTHAGDELTTIDEGAPGPIEGGD